MIKTDEIGQSQFVLVILGPNERVTVHFDPSKLVGHGSFWFFLIRLWRDDSRSHREIKSIAYFMIQSLISWSARFKIGWHKIALNNSFEFLSSAEPSFLYVMLHNLCIGTMQNRFLNLDNFFICLTYDDLMVGISSGTNCFW